MEEVKAEIANLLALNLPLWEEFESIVLQSRPLIDLRAPVEFAQGAFEGAVNLPLMSDEERAAIGTRYKEQGNLAAVALGKALVAPQKEQLIAKWSDFIKSHPDALIYCFRGGQRSAIAQGWLHEAGVDIDRLKGGYKAFRSFLTQRSLEIGKSSKKLIVAGTTGSGKTELIYKIQNSIDLEGLAKHRGSAFGPQAQPQPTQIAFENDLAYALIRHNAKRHNYLVIEDESHNIGRTYIPKPLFESLKDGEYIELITPIDRRVAITFEEYVPKAIAQYEQLDTKHGYAMWQEYVKNSLQKIHRRLGGERFEAMNTQLDVAFAGYERGDNEPFFEWIKILLEEYYDPMYNYQMQKSTKRFVFRGSESEVIEYIEEKEHAKA